jgi:hypothetical protein
MNAVKTLSVVNPSIDTIGVFKSIAAACAAFDVSLATVQGHIETLKTAKIVFGKSKKTCQYRVQMNDAMKVAYKGKAEKTYANYVTAIVASVNDGVPFSFSASKGKGKGGKATATTDTDKMLSALLNVWKLSDVADEIMVQVETVMADGTPLIDAIVDVLKFHGIELPAE